MWYYKPILSNVVEVGANVTIAIKQYSRHFDKWMHINNLKFCCQLFKVCFNPGLKINPVSNIQFPHCLGILAMPNR